MLGVGQPITLVGQLSHGPTRLPAPLVVLHCLVKCFQRRYDKANREIGLPRRNWRFSRSDCSKMRIHPGRDLSPMKNMFTHG